jgi:hypothetical protein
MHRMHQAVAPSAAVALGRGRHPRLGLGPSPRDGVTVVTRDRPSSAAVALCRGRAAVTLGCHGAAVTERHGPQRPPHQALKRDRPSRQAATPVTVDGLA